MGNSGNRRASGGAGCVPMHIGIEGVGKRYRGDSWALRGLTLGLGHGVTGLLGPNGAGKSTLMNILATITRPSEGRVLLDGVDIERDPDAMRRVLGYLPQDFGVYPNLSAREFLDYLAAVKGVPRAAARTRIEELLDLLNLGSAANRPLGGYSGGMRQRVGIAQALLNDPAVLIVDEPTVGLDPEERMRFRHLIADISGTRIVILSTHIVSDLEATASRIALLEHGRLLRVDTPEALMSEVEGRVWDWVVEVGQLAEVRERYQVSSTLRRGDGIQVRVIAGTAPGAGAVPRPASLEDAYLHAKARAGVHAGEAGA